MDNKNILKNLITNITAKLINKLTFFWIPDPVYLKPYLIDLHTRLTIYFNDTYHGFITNEIINKS